MIAIDNSKIEAMVAQMRTAVSNVQMPKSPDTESSEPTQGAVDFAKVFKTQLDQLNQTQNTSQQLGQQFSLGDKSVNLSDVMIATQKASIELQTSVQVRNKLVTAYHDIMNMQV